MNLLCETVRFLLLPAAALVLLAGCQKTSSPTDASPALRVGMELSYPPFEMTDGEGKPAGISVELARALANQMGRELQIENIAFDGLIPALKTGKIDCIISSLTVTPERARAVDFSQPYLSTGLAAVVHQASSVTETGQLNATGRTIVVKKGTTAHILAPQHFPNATLLVLDRDAAAVLEVLQGKADAFLYDQFSVFRYAQQHAPLLRPLLDPWHQEQWAIAVRQGNKELLGQVNQFLNDYRATGGFRSLSSRFLGEMQAKFEELGMRFVF